jgi:GNAT superfamily N-acetyltransferase
MTGAVTVRLAVRADIPAIQAIEIAAGRLFAEIGMHDVAEDGAHETAVLARYVAAGRAWIAETDGRVCGYALADVLDGAAHLEQVTVDPEWGRRGIGRRLIDAVVGWAKADGRSALTLLTFRDVAWNGPYYARLGFAELPDDRIGPELTALRRHEADLGLDVDARGAMVLLLG